MRPFDLPDELDNRLKEWAWVYRDRPMRARSCASAEKFFRRWTDPDFMEEGPKPERRPSYNTLLAAETDHCIRRVCDKPQRWAVTYAYCYPYLARGAVLGAMRHRTGRRMNWHQFLDLLDFARVRIYTCLYIHAVGIDSKA